MDVEGLSSLKPFLLLVIAIPTGLFVRTLGEFFVTWAKKPGEDEKKSKSTRATFLALCDSLRTALGYCKAMADNLKEVPIEGGGLNEQLKKAAYDAGYMLIIPTFNLDLSVLNEQATSVYELLDEEKAQEIKTTRLELAHVHRRIDIIADKIMLLPSMNTLTQQHYAYIEGVRQLLCSAIKHCETSIATLSNEIGLIPMRYPFNWRPYKVVTVMICIFIAMLYLISLIPNSDEKQDKKNIPDHSRGVNMIESHSDKNNKNRPDIEKQAVKPSKK